MSDPERLTEAIDYFEQEWQFNGRPYLWNAGQAIKSRPVVLAAARAYRDGKQVWWCEEHWLPMSDPSEAHEEVCAVFYFAGIDEDDLDDCVIVSKLLVDPTTEEMR